MQQIEEMKIKLPMGQELLIDSIDLPIFNKYHWYFGGRYVTAHSKREDGGDKKILLHRVILRDLLNDNLCVDHINGDGLDNRRSNLRVTNNFGNTRNARKLKILTSKYKGVCRNTRNKDKVNFRAVIKPNRKQIHIGTFDTEEQAAYAYNLKAIELFGEFANLNILPKESYYLPSVSERKSKAMKEVHERRRNKR